MILNSNLYVKLTRQNRNEATNWNMTVIHYSYSLIGFHGKNVPMVSYKYIT